MEAGYQFTSCQAPGVGSAGNSLLVQQQPCSSALAEHQQYYYEYQPNCTDYLFTPTSQIQAQPSVTSYFSSHETQIYQSSQFANFTSNNVYAQTPAFLPEVTVVPESFDFSQFQDSSVFLSPKASTASSSASQSPEQQSSVDLVDLSLDELLKNIGSEEDNSIFGNKCQEDLAFSETELLEVLKDVVGGEEDFFSELNFDDVVVGSEEPFLSESNTLELGSNISSSYSESSFSNSPSSNSSASSVTSTPKRKYSSDSSHSFFSESSFNSASTNSTTQELESPPKPKRARTRTPKTNPVEKAARKKDQNKRAACRYRSKKKVELQSSEMTMEELEAQRDDLSEQVKKLQTEFAVILPLAGAAFTFDPVKREALAALLGRVGSLLK